MTGPAAPPFARERLHAQGLVQPLADDAPGVVHALGAVQSQDFGAAKWAISLRSPALTDASIDAAFDRGALLRTHVLRPTWHFVHPQDVRSWLTLSAARVHAACAYQRRQHDLTARTLSRAADVFARETQGGRFRTRDELARALTKKRIAADDGTALAHMLIFAELEQVVVSGPRRGKQHTYALFTERVPESPALPRDEALADLAARYVRSHGPARAHDFAWWSGLTVTEAQRAMAAACADGALETHVFDGVAHYRGAGTNDRQTKRRPRGRGPVALLLPPYDESLVGYQDGNRAIDPSLARSFGRIALGYANPLVQVDGAVVGSWQRTISARAVVLCARTFPLDPRAVRALHAEGERFARFVGKPLRWEPIQGVRNESVPK